MSSGQENGGILWRWGVCMYRLRWMTAAVCLLLFLGLGHYAMQVPGLLKDNGFAPRGSDSDAGFAMLQEELGESPSSITLVYRSEQGQDLTAPTPASKILESLDSLYSLPYVRRFAVNETARLKERKDIQSVQVELNLSPSDALDRYPEFRNLVAAPRGMKVFVNGPVATLYDIQQATKKDLAKSEMLGLPIALIVLLLIFGTLWAAVLPLIIGSMSVAMTLGIVYFLAEWYRLSNFLPNLVAMVGLAIGIDYALFVVSRFREELERYDDVEQAVGATCRTAGKSIIYSGIAVLIGMLGMLFIQLPVMRSLCLGGVLVVLSSVLLSNTLLPALLGILGRKINRFSFISGLQRRRSASTAWERIAFTVMKRPVFLVLVISGLLILLMLPIGGIKLGVPTAEVLPPAYESRQGADLLKDTYDIREASPVKIVVRSQGSIWGEEAVRQVHAYTERIRRLPEVRRVTSYLTLLGERPPAQTAVLLESGQTRGRMEALRLARGVTAQLVLVPKSDPEAEATEALIRELRTVDPGTLETYT